MGMIPTLHFVAVARLEFVAKPTHRGLVRHVLCCDGSAAKDVMSNARGWFIPGVTEPPSNTAYTVKSSKQVTSMTVFVTEEENAWVWNAHDDMLAYCKKHALPMPAQDQKKQAAMNALEMQYACTAFLEHCTGKSIPVKAIVLDRAK